MFIPDVLTDEQQALADATRGLFAHRADEARLREAIEDDRLDRDLWGRIADLGILGLGVSEELGGSGGDLADEFIAFREAGRVLLRAPLLASAGLAKHLLLGVATDTACKTFLPTLASGERILTAALHDEGRLGLGAEVVTTADEDDRITGEKVQVLDASVADVILVVARAADGVGLYAVERDAVGLEVTPLETLDLTRPAGDVSLRQTPATRLSAPGDHTAAIADAVDAAAVLLAAEQVGGAEAIMSSALDYAKTREQFGQTIGSFQAIKHKLAEMTLDLERMTAAAWDAAESEDRPARQRAIAVDVAQVFCSEAYFRLAADNIQVHGGIGFTWEHPAHLFFRRAKASEFLLGIPHERRARLMSALESTAAADSVA